jgi:hypothetical protein
MKYTIEVTELFVVRFDQSVDGRGPWDGDTYYFHEKEHAEKVVKFKLGAWNSSGSLSSVIYMPNQKLPSFIYSSDREFAQSKLTLKQAREYGYA